MSGNGNNQQAEKTEKAPRTPWNAGKVADEVKGAAERIDRAERLGAGDNVLQLKDRMELRDIRRRLEDFEMRFRLQAESEDAGEDGTRHVAG